MYTDHTTQRKSQKETMTRHHNANVHEIEKKKKPIRIYNHATRNN